MKAIKTKQFFLFLFLLSVSLISAFVIISSSNNAQAQGTKKSGDSCNISDDCSGDLICSPSGKCLAFNGEICSSADECSSGSCVNNVCKGTSGENGTCNDSDDCIQGHTCKDRKCVITSASDKTASAPTCKIDADCGAGRTCTYIQEGGDLQVTYSEKKYCITIKASCNFTQQDCAGVAGCTPETCKCINTRDSNSSFSPLKQRCVHTSELGQGVPCDSTKASPSDLQSTCGNGYTCDKTTSKCTLQENALSENQKCNNSTQCNNASLTCRTADSRDVTKNTKYDPAKGNTSTIQEGQAYCLPTLGDGASCKSTNECSNNRDCINTYPSDFVSKNGTPTYKPDTDGKATCAKEFTKEVKTTNGKSEYICKSKDKQCADEKNPTHKSSEGDRADTNLASQTCNKDVEKGFFTQNVTNACLNCGECTVCDIVNTVSSGANSILALAAPLAGLFIVIGGIMYMTSGGNQERQGTAKSTITYAILGLIVMLAGYLIVLTIMSAIGAKNAGNLLKPNYQCNTNAWKWKSFKS